MTKEQAKELWPVIKAWEEGKTIEYIAHRGVPQYWTQMSSNNIGFDINNYNYRIKPTSTYRPWKPEEVPVGCLMRSKGVSFTLCYIIVAVSPNNDGTVRVVEDVGIRGHNFKYCLDNFEWSNDQGKTWLPCGVLVEG